MIKKEKKFFQIIQDYLITENKISTVFATWRSSYDSDFKYLIEITNLKFNDRVYSLPEMTQYFQTIVLNNQEYFKCDITFTMQNLKSNIKYQETIPYFTIKSKIKLNGEDGLIELSDNTFRKLSKNFKQEKFFEVKS